MTEKSVLIGVNKSRFLCILAYDLLKVTRISFRFPFRHNVLTLTCEKMLCFTVRRLEQLKTKRIVSLVLCVSTVRRVETLKTERIVPLCKGCSTFVK